MRGIARYAFVSLSLCSVGLLSSCHDRAAIYTTPGGLKVTAAAVAPDDTAQMMDMKFWKFSVDAPKPGQGLDCKLEVREKGKPPLVLSGMGTSPVKSDRSTHIDVEIALYPLAGDLTAPGKLKSFCRMNGGSGTSFSDNPFSGASGVATGDPLPTPDGGWMLLTAGKTASWPPDAKNLVLVCKFTATHYKLPK